MNVTVQRAENNTFIARGDSNHWVVLDTHKKHGGQDAATSPMEMVLCALGGCTGMDVESLLQKMRTPVDKFRIIISAERREEHPRIFTKIDMKFIFHGENLNADSIAKAVKLSREKYCSVSAMLAQSAQMTYEILINPTEV
ncbi:MAG: OsmC family protein [Candidatus Neomarinimicrobiota bacterium]